MEEKTAHIFKRKPGRPKGTKTDTLSGYNIVRAEEIQEKKNRFLIAYRSMYPNASKVCRELSIPYRTYMEWKEKDLEFLREIDVIREEVADELEDRLYNAAQNERGMQSLLVTILKAERGKKYSSERSNNVNTVVMYSEDVQPAAAATAHTSVVAPIDRDSATQTPS